MHLAVVAQFHCLGTKIPPPSKVQCGEAAALAWDNQRILEEPCHTQPSRMAMLRRISPTVAQEAAHHIRVKQHIQAVALRRLVVCGTLLPKPNLKLVPVMAPAGK
jgi:hypothetical protein